MKIYMIIILISIYVHGGLSLNKNCHLYGWIEYSNRKGVWWSTGGIMVRPQIRYGFHGFMDSESKLSDVIAKSCQFGDIERFKGVFF